MTSASVQPTAPSENSPDSSSSSFLHQPRAVWAVAFACVIAFMGIGLVDPILKPIADQLDATPSQVSLLFTSYMAVMGVAMLITGVVASRIAAMATPTPNKVGRMRSTCLLCMVGRQRPISRSVTSAAC